MTEVKVHPHRTMVNAGVEACVSVTPTPTPAKPKPRAYYMGTVMLRNVRFVIHPSGVQRARKEQRRNVHAWCVGELLWENPMQNPLVGGVRKNMVQVTYHYNIGRFIEVLPKGFIGPPRDLTDNTFKAAYFCGRDFYVSKD